MIHQETLRHRKIYIQDFLDGDFSFSVSSARAIPFAKMIAEVKDDALRASPIYWGAEQKGMSPGGELSESLKAAAQEAWKGAALMAAGAAEILYGIGVHKSLANRIIEPYLHVNCLCTATENGWLNFFGLRLDSAADPTLRALAEQAWIVWNESQPQKLNPGEWHLPYIEEDEFAHNSNPNLIWSTDPNYPGTNLTCLDIAKRVSTARNARLSLMSFETQKKASVDENLNLYNRLVGGNILHASPAEHLATPDKLIANHNHNFRGGAFWEKPHLAGNLGPGWIQLRKMLPNEAIAPLPKEYLK
jgi:hypothetical protein